MSNISESLNSLMQVSGAIVASVVDSNSGMMLGQAGSGINLELASAGNTEVVRAKMKTMETNGKRIRIGFMIIDTCLRTTGHPAV